MAVNLINGNDTTITKTSDDIQVEFSQSRKQQIEEIENNIETLSNLQPTTLYNNTTGSNTTITLNDSIENYEYVEIFYRNNDDFYSSRKFHQPSGKKLVLDSYYISSSTFSFKFNYITIAGTTLTRNQFIEANRSGSAEVFTNANTYITRVVGYKS